MFRALVLALALGAVSAFLPAARITRPSVQMTAESSRREFTSAAAAVLVGAGFAQGAQAVAGEGPKFSFFGITKGQAVLLSEGASFGTDQSQPVYSPYSPYSPPSDKSLAASLDTSKANKAVVAESAKRLQNNYASYIAKKEWLNVKAENTRYLYSLRKAMNTLATTAEQKAAAKKVYVDLEAMTYAATIKDQAACSKAWEAAKADLSEFSKSV